MDLSLLPTPVSEHRKQSARSLFTIRSASSPSYGLGRRGGVRKSRDSPEEGSGRSEGAGESGGPAGPLTNKVESRSSAGWRGGVKANNTSDPIMSAQLNQNGSADQTKTGLDTDGSVNSNPPSERRGRAEWKRHELPSRSKSLDVRTGKRSPDGGESHGLLVMSSARGGTHAAGPAERRTEREGERGRVRSSVQVFNSVGTADGDKDASQPSDLGGTLNRADRGNSLPSRLGSVFGPGSDNRGTAATLGPKGSRSILERIEKLYGSAGFSKTEDYSRIRDASKPAPSHHKEAATDFSVSPQQRSHERATGGTFPRRFSSGSTHSPGASARPSTWTQSDTSETYPSPGTPRLLRGQTEDRFSGDRGLSRGRASENFGTMSLDRVRSRYSVAAQLRSARAAGEIATPPPPNSSLQEEGTPSWRDSLRPSERRGAGREVKEKFEEEEKKPDNGAKAAFKCSPEEDAFESHPQRAATKGSEQKKAPETEPASSTDSVKNRINQFEALTQRFQDLAPGQSLPRRTFSVPAKASRALGGVKKSSSAKAIGGLKDRSEGSKEAAEAKETYARAKVGSGRSLSVDEVGLRLEERERNDLDHGANNFAEDFQKYSSLRNTLEIPPKRENQEPPGSVSIDETDFTKIPDEARKRPTYLLLPACSDAGGQQASPSPTEDETPSITPTNSPHLSPVSLANTTATRPGAETAPGDAAKSPKEEPPLLPGPLTASPRSRDPRLLPSDVDGGLPNRRRQFMDAWLSGLSTGIRVWDDSEDEDDDASTQKDEDSNYDSDSGESSFTITSNMSQSEQRSFCVSLSDLCNFAGVDYESEAEDDSWRVNTRRSASLSSNMSALSCVSVLPSEELDKLLEDVRSLGDSNLQDYNAVQVVVLHKEMGMGLGFSVAGGVDQNKPVTVHRVFPSGVAAQEGSIQEGDPILSINGTSLCGCAHWEALKVLRRARIRDLGVVVLRRGEDCTVSKVGEETSGGDPKQAQVMEKGQRVLVRLEKKGRDLGFSLAGGAGSTQENRPITVQKIFQGGPVDQVFPGDEVLEIDGVSTTGMRRIEAWNLIRKLPAGPADLVLRRPHQET